MSSYSLHDIVMWLQFINIGDQSVGFLKNHYAVMDGYTLLEMRSNEELIQELELKSREAHMAILALTHYQQVLYKEVELLQLVNEMRLNYFRELNSKGDMEYSLINNQRHTITRNDREDIRPDKSNVSSTFAG